MCIWICHLINFTNDVLNFFQKTIIIFLIIFEMENVTFILKEFFKMYTSFLNIYYYWIWPKKFWTLQFYTFQQWLFEDFFIIITFFMFFLQKIHVIYFSNIYAQKIKKIFNEIYF
jgi:hypothetical protein